MDSPSWPTDRLAKLLPLLGSIEKNQRQAAWSGIHAILKAEGFAGVIEFLDGRPSSEVPHPEAAQLVAEIVNIRRRLRDRIQARQPGRSSPPGPRRAPDIATRADLLQLAAELGFQHVEAPRGPDKFELENGTIIFGPGRDSSIYASSNVAARLRAAKEFAARHGGGGA